MLRSPKHALSQSTTPSACTPFWQKSTLLRWGGRRTWSIEVDFVQDGPVFVILKPQPAPVRTPRGQQLLGAKEEERSAENLLSLP